ncbi:MAG: preprotein translocase subunit SecE [Dehalococcoidia bacterium]|nr:preprotein translocase subunit SecE [Dehalococcoidia bacterium]
MVKVSGMTGRVKRFLDEAKAELKKVTWPTRKQAIASTAVVIVVVIILSIFLSLVDLGLTKMIKLILG